MEKAIQKIERRIARLEEAVFGGSRRRSIPAARNTNTSGPAGGVRTLVEMGFFKSKRNLGDVRTELGKHDYHYGTQAIDTALRRLSKKNGPLVIVKQKGTNFYVKRK